MALFDVVLQVLGVVFALIFGVLIVVVGSDRVRGGRRNVHENVRANATAIVVLGVVLAANSIIRKVGIDLSWIIGVNITGYLHAIEGNVVPTIQSFATPAFTAYFSAVYVVGYTFLLVFPFAAYLLLRDPIPVRKLIVAYIVNYGVGLVCYVIFVAYGPRNFLPDLVEPLLYTYWPQSQLITSEVNSNTNVFPSLHSSLSVTVAILAYRTREYYPRWVPVAVFLALSVCISTMYLGIHWATDVVAGALLAVFSVYAADRATEVYAADSHWRLDAEGPLGGRLSALDRWLRGN